MPDQNLPKTSQIFRWFEKMINSYEIKVQNTLNKFESYSLAQQKRIDDANHEHITNLELLHNQKHELNQNTIQHLHSNIKHYKKHIEQQQKTIEQLNTRHDAVLSCLLYEKRQDIDFTEKHSKHDIYQSADTERDSELRTLSTVTEAYPPSSIKNKTDHAGDFSLSEDESINKIYEQAVTHRNGKNFPVAFVLFEQAALMSSAKAMGAVGRSYFLGEGVSINQTLGLAWLINAAKNHLPQAISRVEQFKQQQPNLYNQALQLAATLK